MCDAPQGHIQTDLPNSAHNYDDIIAPMQVSEAEVGDGYIEIQYGTGTKKVKAVSGGGINVAIEVTGVGAGLDEALDCMAKFGRVALLGCTRSSDFTIDYYKKVHAPGITIIGAHTIARPEYESHPGWFTHRDDIKSVLRLLSGGRLDLESLVEETHSPTECGEVYKRLVFDKNFPIVVQFDWRML